MLALNQQSRTSHILTHTSLIFSIFQRAKIKSPLGATKPSSLPTSRYIGSVMMIVLMIMLMLCKSTVSMISSRNFKNSLILSHKILQTPRQCHGIIDSPYDDIETYLSEHILETGVY